MKPYRTKNKRLDLLKKNYHLYGKKTVTIKVAAGAELLSYKYLENRGFVKLERVEDNEKYKLIILSAGIEFLKQHEE